MHFAREKVCVKSASIPYKSRRVALLIHAIKQCQMIEVRSELLEYIPGPNHLYIRHGLIDMSLLIASR